MITHDEVRHICSNLPGATEEAGRFAFGVMVKGKHKGFVWSWAERVDPKKARVINDSVLVVVTPNLAAKEAIIASNPKKFFTEPHYNGFSAVLVRLEEVDIEEMEDLVLEAWRCKAPPELRSLHEPTNR